MVDHELLELRRALTRVVRGRGKRYPEALRGRIVAWAMGKMEKGEEIATLAAAIRIHPDTIRVWTTEHGAVFRPVEVGADTTAGAATAGERRVSVVSPKGYRVDGLSLDEAAALLRVIG